MGLGKFIKNTSPLYGAVTGKGALGGLRSISPMGQGLKALGVNDKKKKDEEEAAAKGVKPAMKCGGETKMAKGGSTSSPERVAAARASTKRTLKEYDESQRKVAANKPLNAAKKALRSIGEAKIFASGGDVTSTGLELPKVKKAFSEDITFESSPVVQDISKKDRSADDAANARRAARKAPATKARSSSASPKTNLPTGGRGGPKNVTSPKPTPKGIAAKVAPPPDRKPERGGPIKAPDRKPERGPVTAADRKLFESTSKPRGGWGEAARKGPGPMMKKPDYTGPMSKTPKAAPDYKGPMSKSSPTFRTPKAAAPAKKQVAYPVRNRMPDAKPAAKTDWSAAAKKGPSSAMAKPKEPPKYTGPMAKKAKGGVIGFAKGGSIDGCARKGKTRCTKR